MKKTALCVGAICLLALTVRVGSGNQPESESTRPDPISTTQPAKDAWHAEPHSLKVVTYNIRQGRYGLDRIATYLRDQQADIILLQEVLRRGEKRDEGQAETLAQLIGDYHWVSGDSVKLGDQQYCDVAILARRPLEDVVCHEAPAGGRVFAISARLTGPRQPLRVMSVHATSTARLESARIAKTTAQRFAEMTALLDYVRKYEGNLLIAGDFNAAPWMPEYHSLTRELADLAPASERDKHTFPAHRPSIRIDYVFARGPISATSYTVDQARLSDHLPVIADLRLNEGVSASPTTRPTTQRGDSGSDHSLRENANGDQPNR